MHTELLDVAKNTPWDFRTRPSGPLRELISEDSRFEGWHDAFRKARRVLQDVKHHYGGKYWRVNTELPEINLDPPQTNEKLDVLQQAQTKDLIELILWARAPEDDLVIPGLPTPEGIFETYKLIHEEPVGPDPGIEIEDFPGITWWSVIDAMVDGRVRVGPAEA